LVNDSKGIHPEINTYVRGIKPFLLGQLFMLHDWDSECVPWQYLPPRCGGGLVHDRRRIRFPPPHVTVHLVQAPQDDQPPLTRMLIFYRD